MLLGVSITNIFCSYCEMFDELCRYQCWHDSDSWFDIRDDNDYVYHRRHTYKNKTRCACCAISNEQQQKKTLSLSHPLQITHSKCQFYRIEFKCRLYQQPQPEQNWMSSHFPLYNIGSKVSQYHDSILNWICACRFVPPQKWESAAVKTAAPNIPFSRHIQLLHSIKWSGCAFVLGVFGDIKCTRVRAKEHIDRAIGLSHMTHEPGAMAFRTGKSIQFLFSYF